MDVRDRLRPLLQWLNYHYEDEDRREERAWDSEDADAPRRVLPTMTVPEVRKRLLAFVRSFETGEAVLVGRVVTDPRKWTPMLTFTGADPDFWTSASPRDVEEQHQFNLLFLLRRLLQRRVRKVPLPSLQFGIGEDCTLVVSGELPQIVAYLVMRTVVDDLVDFGICAAPKGGTRCGNLFVRAGRSRGQPQKWCGATCRSAGREKR